MKEPEKKGSKVLRVEEGILGDVGKGIARIPRLLAFQSNFREGSAIVIRSKKKETAAIVKLDDVYESDFIRLDNMTRRNAGVALNDNVVIEPVNPVPAVEVTVAPVEEGLVHIHEGLIEKYVREYLTGRVLTRFDLFDFNLFNEIVVMTVSFISPKDAGAVVFTDKTELKLRKNPV
ncbi:MAG: hypothetical protein ACTSP4_11795, partial [Candidatus Hodarchaeales archaeon]